MATLPSDVSCFHRASSSALFLIEEELHTCRNTSSRSIGGLSGGSLGAFQMAQIA
jgi:hypothetical protein